METMESASGNQPMGQKYYPMFVSLENKVCVVVGGGGVGERKIKKLLECGATVQLIAKELTPWLEKQRLAGTIHFLGGDYDESLLDNADLVFAATSNPNLNRRIARAAAQKRIWCNTVTDPSRGSFIVPAVFERGHLSIAVSTSGLSPALARKIRRLLELEFGDEWDGYLNFLGRLRSAIQEKHLGTEHNQQIFKELVGLPLLEWIRQKRWDDILEAVTQTCHPWLSREEITQIWDQTWIAFS